MHIDLIKPRNLQACKARQGQGPFMVGPGQALVLLSCDTGKPYTNVSAK